MSKLLKDKVCIVTGAARGIGRAIAERFAEDGAIVYACDIIDNDTAIWAKELSEKFQVKIIPLFFDITDVTSTKNVLMDIFKQQGKIDCLVNNAAIISNKKIGMILRDDLEKMFRVNVYAVIETIQTISRLMARTHGGSIINIASITAVNGSAGQVAYSASKGAVIALTKSCAKELAAHNIRVNAIAPGIVKTERFEELYEVNGSKIDNRINQIALGRLASPLDIANACSFLASDRADYISGQVLGVDGCSSL